MSDEADVDGFLNHRGGSGGSFGAILGTKWHKIGKLDLWFYMPQTPKPVWRHGFQKIQVRTDKDTREPTKEVWGDNFVCHEPEIVLKDRERDDDGNRKMPYLYCPFCRFAEKMRELVRDEKIKWTTPIFKFVGDDESKNVIIHAGGVYNAFGARDGEAINRLGIPRDMEIVKRLEEAKKDPANWWRHAMKDAHINARFAWKENTLSKLSYLFLIVQHEAPAGVQIAIETELLGNKVKAMVRRERQGKPENDVKGNPWKTPYLIRWKYDADAADIKDRYDAMPIRDVECPPKILKLIQGDACPDYSVHIEPGNLQTLRATMERYSTKQLRAVIDWDEIFKVKTRGEESAKPRTARASAKDESEDEEEEKPKPKGPALVKCDDCKKMIPANARKCPTPGCDAEYEIDEEEEKAPPPKKKPEPKAEEEDEEEEEKPKAKVKKKPEPEEDEDEEEKPKPKAKGNGPGAGGKKAPAPPEDDEEDGSDDDVPFIRQARGF